MPSAPTAEMPFGFEAEGILNTFAVAMNASFGRIPSKIAGTG